MSVTFDSARKNLPLPDLMRQHGDFIPPDKKSGFECPVCHNKKSGQCRFYNGKWWFKCWKSDCASGTRGPQKSWDEVGYLSFKTGLSATNGCAPSRDKPGRYSDAAIAYLKEAGVWTEERMPPQHHAGSKSPAREPCAAHGRGAMVHAERGGRGDSGPLDDEPREYVALRNLVAGDGNQFADYKKFAGR